MKDTGGERRKGMSPKKEAEKNKAVWDGLVAHVGRGEEAVKLLEAVYVEMGPYRQDKVSDETWRKVCDFFGFDDSE